MLDKNGQRQQRRGLICLLLFALILVPGAMAQEAIVADQVAVDLFGMLPDSVFPIVRAMHVQFLGGQGGLDLLGGCRILALLDSRCLLDASLAAGGDRGSDAGLRIFQDCSQEAAGCREWIAAQLADLTAGGRERAVLGLELPRASDAEGSADGGCESGLWRLLRECAGSLPVFLATVPVWGDGEENFRRHLGNEAVRALCRENPRLILFDGAAILAHGAQGDRHLAVWTDAAGKPHFYPALHPENREDLDGGCRTAAAGIGQKGSLRLARAFWWLLARISGWNAASASVTVQAPNGGEIWRMGTSQTITWTQSGLSGLLTLELYQGASLRTTIGQALASLQSYIWVVPTYLSTGFDYKVRIQQSPVEDYSDYPFTIYTGTLTTHTLTFVAGTGGSVSGRSPQTIFHGGFSLPVSAVPATAYHFVNWTGTGGFTPTTANPLTVTNVTADMVITANFAPDSPVTYAVSGRVTLQGSGLGGVAMTGFPAATATNSQGYYTASVPAGWSGTVRPVLSGYTFTPDHRDYSAVGADITGQDYSAASQGGQTYTISGRVTYNGAGLASVMLSGLPGNPLTNSSGDYTATVNAGWSGTASPQLAGYTFSPPSRTYTNVASDQSNQNYTAALQGGQSYTISGRVTLSGNGLAGVLLSGLPGAPETNAQGYYSATVNSGWSGTVIPLLTGHVFTPGSMTYTNVRSNLETNYIAEQRNPRLRFSARPGGRLEGALQQEVPYGGSSSPVLAVANEGFSFLSWTDRSGFYSQMNPLVISGVNRDMDVTANFSGSIGNDKFYLLNPVNGSKVWGPLIMVAEAAPGIDVERAEFSVDGIRLADAARRLVTRAGASAQAAGQRFTAGWDTRQAQVGWHQVTATGFLRGGGKYVDDILVYVENVSLTLRAERRMDRSLRLQRHYAWMQLEAYDLGGVTINRIAIYRAENSGEFTLLKEVAAGDLKEGKYEYRDAYLDENKRYRYKAEALDGRGWIVGASEEVVL